MRETMTAVLERDGITGPTYTTEPYEVAWAKEARWFVRTLDIPDAVEGVSLLVQISPDGLHWCDSHDEPPVIDSAGVVSWVSREFGGWLRLRATVHGNGSGTVPALIYLVLKS